MDSLCNLQRLLNKRGVAAQLSRDTGIAKQTISTWSKGERKPQADHLATLSQYFGYSPFILLSDNVDLLAPEKEQSPIKAGRLANLTMARKANGLSMERLGLAVGISEDDVAHFEAGELQPSDEILNKIASVLGYSVDYLIERNSAFLPPASSNAKKAPAEAGELDEIDAEIMRVASSLSDADKLKVLEIAELLALKQGQE